MSLVIFHSSTKPAICYDSASFFNNQMEKQLMALQKYRKVGLSKHFLFLHLVVAQGGISLCKSLRDPDNLHSLSIQELAPYMHSNITNKHFTTFGESCYLKCINFASTSTCIRFPEVTIFLKVSRLLNRFLVEKFTYIGLFRVKLPQKALLFYYLQNIAWMVVVKQFAEEIEPIKGWKATIAQQPNPSIRFSYIEYYER